MKKPKILSILVLALSLLILWTIRDTGAEENQKNAASDKTGQIIVQIGAKRDREIHKEEVEKVEKELRKKLEKMHEKIRKEKDEIHE